MNFKREFRILPWLICAVLAVAAYFLRFVFWGYSFSAMVCCGIIAIIAFYEITRMLRIKYSRGMKLLRRVFTVCLCIGLLIVGITECFIIKASFGDPGKHCDYMVVLGAKVRVTGPSASLWDRIYGAYDYMVEHPDVIAIVSGGQGDDEPMTEAESMQAELILLGIDPDRIWLEDQATSTLENLDFSMKLVEEKAGSRPAKIGVLSSEFHLLRANMFATRQNVAAITIPAKTSDPGTFWGYFLREILMVWYYGLIG